MPNSFKTVALVARCDAVGIGQTITEISEFLHHTGHKIVYESQTALLMSEAHSSMTLDEIGQYADLAIVVGGDGLFHEVCNGMLNRIDQCMVPIGISTALVGSAPLGFVNHS